MENSLEGFKGRFEQAEEKISELEYKTMEIIEVEEQKDFKKQTDPRNTLGDPKRTLRELWDTNRKTNMHIMQAAEGEERKRGRENM